MRTEMQIKETTPPPDPPTRTFTIDGLEVRHLFFLRATMKNKLKSKQDSALYRMLDTILKGISDTPT